MHKLGAGTDEGQFRLKVVHLRKRSCTQSYKKKKKMQCTLPCKIGLRALNANFRQSRNYVIFVSRNQVNLRMRQV